MVWNMDRVKRKNFLKVVVVQRWRRQGVGVCGGLWLENFKVKWSLCNEIMSSFSLPRKQLVFFVRSSRS